MFFDVDTVLLSSTSLKQTLVPVFNTFMSKTDVDDVDVR